MHIPGPFYKGLREFKRNLKNVLMVYTELNNITERTSCLTEAHLHYHYHIL